MKKSHIYIHVPFCESKCPYCAFGSDVNLRGIPAYFAALLSEIKAANLGEISTIFIGGGTPSVVRAEFYAPIFEILNKFLDKSPEITVEANPNSASLKWLSQMKNLGVNRVSFGAQSFDEKKLKFLGRIHSAKQIYKAVENAKIAGLERINVDLIYMSKFDTKKMLEFECENIANLGISHVSAYALTLEIDTPFFSHKNFAKNSPNLAKFLFRNLANLGLNQYEISNFGEICRHNLSYWQGENYLGFGVFAVGFDGEKRLYSPKNTQEYIKNPLKKEFEILSKENLHLERLFLGLRSVVGISKTELNEQELERANLLVNEKKLTEFEGKFYNKNYLLSDEIALFLVS